MHFVYKYYLMSMMDFNKDSGISINKYLFCV